MAWTTPLTAVSNASLTAAQWNASVRDNLLTTAPALATAAGNLFVSSGANSLAQRVPASDTINTSQTTTSTSYVDLATVGPQTNSVVSDIRVITWSTAQFNNGGASNESIVGILISGATSTAPDDNISLDNQSASAFSDITATRVTRWTVTAGTNNFRQQYRVTAGTGTFRRRSLVTLPF